MISVEGNDALMPLFAGGGGVYIDRLVVDEKDSKVF